MRKDLPTDINLTADKDFQLSDELADRLNEEILDFLADKYGYCVEGYGWELKIGGIMWDTSE